MQVIRYVYASFLAIYPIFMWVLAKLTDVFNDPAIIGFTVCIHILCWVGAAIIFKIAREISRQSIDNQ